MRIPMTRRLPLNHLSALQPAIALALAFACTAGITLAQEEALTAGPSRPMFVTLPPHLVQSVGKAAATPLQTWNGSFTYQSSTYNYNMVGTAPSSNTPATIQVYIIPVKVVITSGATKTTYDPLHVLSNGKTVVANTVASPLFDSTTTYVQGGVNVGTTQYIDAYMRAGFWGAVQSAPNYHLLLGGPAVFPEWTLSPPASYGRTGSEFGFKAGLVNINWFDAYIQYYISKVTQIKPGVLPIFLINDVYLTQGGQCCIGGYHSSMGSSSAPQAYAVASYVDHAGAFSEDVSALSHEIGEWAADPLVVNINGNNTPCGILENGDPLENNSNYGAYPYAVNGFSYNLQDLVTLPYFGAPPATSVNGFFTFQGESLAVCANGS